MATFYDGRHILWPIVWQFSACKSLCKFKFYLFCKNNIHSGSLPRTPNGLFKSDWLLNKTRPITSYLIPGTPESFLTVREVWFAAMTSTTLVSIYINWFEWVQIVLCFAYFAYRWQDLPKTGATTLLRIIVSSTDARWFSMEDLGSESSITTQ